MPGSENNSSLTASVLINSREPAPPEIQIDKYEFFLIKIGVSLGLTESESTEFAQQIIACAIKGNLACNDRLSLRIWLSKMMVHKCLFTISSLLFSSTDMVPKGKFLTYKNIPLSFWTVFILYNTIGFKENEIAEILNTTVIQVKYRLNKALASVHKV